jgi:uncharacterized protein (TIGR02147 family)
MRPEIYRYDEYRLYLKDLFQNCKETEHLTYRSFAARAGFSNPGFIVDVIKGRRKLSDESQKKIVSGFRLKDNEAEFFRLLVSYAQAKDENVREDTYKTILFRRNRSSFTRIDSTIVKYYQDFRYTLVRNAIDACDFRGDWTKLSRFFNPIIPETALKNYVRDLCEWGLVTQDERGRYATTRTRKLIEPPTTLYHLVREMNKEWIRQAHDAVEKIPAEDRHISTMVFAVSDKNYEEIRSRIEKFREEIFALIEHDDTPQRVAQLSVQYIPKSMKKGNGL